MSSSPSPAAQPSSPLLLVAAAADLASVQDPLTQAVQRNAGIRIRLILGASGILAQQIAQGAPYDVFLSADEQFVSRLDASGHLLAGSLRTYALGRIALWSKQGTVHSLEDLDKPEVRHVALPNPAHAPYGVAARQALESRGLWSRVEPKVVYGENVRQALQYAESGNTDAVITAWSLLFDRKAVLLPASWHAPIRQAAAIVKRSRYPDQARSFLDFLSGPEGQKLLKKYGLFPAGAPAKRGGSL